MTPRHPTAFEQAAMTLRQLLSYLYRDLKMPPDTIKLQVNGLLLGLQAEELYEQRPIPTQPEGN